MENIQKTLLDVSAPGKKFARGHLHPISIVTKKIMDIFTSMGFEIADGPEIESEYYNFDALNVPKDHPARDMHDTFWIAGKAETILRTHISTIQIRYMEKNKPPIKIVSPGRVFRYEASDATHGFQFHYVEGLMVGEDISLANLKTVLLSFYKELFGQDVTLRLRPSYFPFVEPGVEIDLSCFKCKNQGCSLCKNTGWIEVLGAGMVHPKVLENVGIDSEKYKGFAFGGGLDRIAMLKYGIDDLRLFYESDLRFVNQF